MLGVYEHERDSYKFPSCWHVVNDVCLPHFHSSIEFVYVTDGELKVTLNGVSSFIKKGQILIVSSYTVHFYETVTASEAIILIVPLDFIPTYNKMLTQNDFIRNVYQDRLSESSEILHCMRILSENNVNDKKLSANIIKGYIYVIIGILIENVGLAHNKNDPNRSTAKDILIYLQDHYLSPVSLQLLAKNFGYSASRFSHIFNSCFGCTIADYVNTLRCRHASGLLIDDSVPIINAAMGSGFNSMRTFYRSFRHCYGVTPSQYRDNYAKMRTDEGLPLHHYHL
ncbi:MAG: AraC family transcriptional regulator [Oscillospiraceae bacterium]|jgi:AraC-like DNA-binding protein|nr:AraC family transcriptional regulator [Oscillospiraceae bacterium]